MRTNFFYSTMLLAAAAITLISCSKDDDLLAPEQPQTTAQSFFNLKTGSEWTYKKYENSEAQPQVLSYNGETDHVVVEGNVLANGINYAKIKHTVTNTTDNETYVRYEYAHIDDAGHLISDFQNTDDQTFLAGLSATSGIVMHSGIDMQFKETVQNALGSISYKPAAAANITVEGKQYTVTPFVGTFTPIAGSEAKTLSYDYAEGIGLIRSVSKALDGNYVSEDRLVSYHLAQ